MRFTIRDQKHFAELSGDWNPVHVDPVFARRTVAGQPIVHGIHPRSTTIHTLTDRSGSRWASVVTV